MPNPRIGGLFVPLPLWYKCRDMDPVCFHIFSWPIYWYGVMVATGFLAALAHWSFMAHRQGREPGFSSELGFWMMVCGIVGARVAYVAANFREFAAHPLDIFLIYKGGLVFYGGLIGAAVGLVAFARLRRERLLGVADLAVSALPLGHAIGRVGCFLNGCCYGSPSCVPWAVHVEGAMRHPVQLYEAAANLAIYLVLLALQLRKPRPGAVLAIYLLIYPPARFALEFVRGDPRAPLLGLDVAQILSIALFAAGLALGWFVRRNHDRTSP